MPRPVSFVSMASRHSCVTFRIVNRQTRGRHEVEVEVEVEVGVVVTLLPSSKPPPPSSTSYISRVRLLSIKPSSSWRSVLAGFVSFSPSLRVPGSFFFLRTTTTLRPPRPVVVALLPLELWAGWAGDVAAVVGLPDPEAGVDWEVRLVVGWGKDPNPNPNAGAGEEVEVEVEDPNPNAGGGEGAGWGEDPNPNPNAGAGEEVEVEVEDPNPNAGAGGVEGAGLEKDPNAGAGKGVGWDETSTGCPNPNALAGEAKSGAGPNPKAGAGPEASAGPEAVDAEGLPNPWKAAGVPLSFDKTATIFRRRKGRKGRGAMKKDGRGVGGPHF